MGQTYGGEELTFLKQKPGRRPMSRAGGLRTAAQRTLYDTLGVKQSASPSEIKEAWRHRAKQLHPDAFAHQGGVQPDPGAFVDLLTAREVPNPISPSG